VGAAGAISAIFGAPIGAVIFAIEVILMEISNRFIHPLLNLLCNWIIDFDDSNWQDPVFTLRSRFGSFSPATHALLFITWQWFCE